MVTPERAVTLLDAIHTNEGYMRRKVAAGRLGELAPYADKVRRFLDELAVPPPPVHVEPERVPFVDAPLPTGAWTTQDVTEDYITGRWHVPAVLQPGPVVVTIPGGPGPMPRWEVMDPLVKRLLTRGLPVLAWDWDSSGHDGDLDVRTGVWVAEDTYPEREVVVVAHSLGGFPATRAVLTGLFGERLVVVSAITSRDELGDSLKLLYPWDPRDFGPRRLPVTVIAASDDRVVPPPRMANFADALAAAGYAPRHVLVEGATHDTILAATATVDAIVKGAP